VAATRHDRYITFVVVILGFVYLEVNLPKPVYTDEEKCPSFDTRLAIMKGVKLNVNIYHDTSRHVANLRGTFNPRLLFC
jgi:hypothetical protein